MTITDAIAELNKNKPNMYDDEYKIRWLSRLDRRIYETIIQTHQLNEGETVSAFTPYTANEPNRELLVGEPYDEMYVRFLEAQIDYSNKEFESFNNSNAVFESLYSAFRNAYNQSHMPKGVGKTYF
jgi:hypothetical protein